MAGYLDTLNGNHSVAVEFGVGDDTFPPPLVIAGARSGKTNSLAHRVAYLPINGAATKREM
ncbi:hypothetical protein J4E08_11395 [Sagittula sp. NFXS13]|uniref:hypothetical protein n=1 Tax=Sagittula sp. NFXS13 TaxID=2819095 RepID=UPI0032DE6FDD